MHLHLSHFTSVNEHPGSSFSSVGNGGYYSVAPCPESLYLAIGTAAFRQEPQRGGNSRCSRQRLNHFTTLSAVSTQSWKPAWRILMVLVSTARAQCPSAKSASAQDSPSNTRGSSGAA